MLYWLWMLACGIVLRIVLTSAEKMTKTVSRSAIGTAKQGGVMPVSDVVRVRVCWELPMDHRVYEELGKLLYNIMVYADRIDVEHLDAEGVIMNAHVADERAGMLLLESLYEARKLRLQRVEVDAEWK